MPTKEENKKNAQEQARYNAYNNSDKRAQSKLLSAEITDKFKSTNLYEVIKGIDINDYSNDTIITTVTDNITFSEDDFNKDGFGRGFGMSGGEYGIATATSSINKSKIPNSEAGEDKWNVNDSIANHLIFELPNWGVEDYINERSKWTKGIKSLGDEPGFFYFKVFFKFNTNYGLFGGVLNENGVPLMTTNSALRYLNGIKGKFNGTMLYNQEQIPMRINALMKFTSLLSKINSDYPWMIKGINGIENLMNTYTDGFSEERSIELVFNTETTDMKIINMLNLYKYACYDDINCKEIIPSNLRKFDMMIAVYHVPIKYFQTAILTADKKNLKTGLTKPGSKLAKAENIINSAVNFLTNKSVYFKYKRMHPDNNNYSNMMSFQLFTLQNCEFDVSSFGNYFTGSDFKNEQAFQFVETPIKIKYDRVYFHNMNEWNQMLYGSDGFIYDVNFPDGSELDNVNLIRTGGAQDQKNYFQERLNALIKAKEDSWFFDKHATQYKAMIDYAESIITDGMMSMTFKDYYSFLQGNIYGGNFTSIESDYYKNKLSILKNGNISGNIYGKKLGPGTNYFEQKLKWLKEGTINSDGQKLPYTDEEGNEKNASLTAIFEEAEDYNYNKDEIKSKGKDIQNYLLNALNGRNGSGGMFSDAINSINNTAAFFGVGSFL